jgi:hypothetical protein
MKGIENVLPFLLGLGAGIIARDVVAAAPPLTVESTQMLLASMGAGPVAVTTLNPSVLTPEDLIATTFRSQPIVDVDWYYNSSNHTDGDRSFMMIGALLGGVESVEIVLEPATPVNIGTVENPFMAPRFRVVSGAPSPHIFAHVDSLGDLPLPQIPVSHTIGQHGFEFQAGVDYDLGRDGNGAVAGSSNTFVVIPGEELEAGDVFFVMHTTTEASNVHQLVGETLTLTVSAALGCVDFAALGYTSEQLALGLAVNSFPVTKPTTVVL